MIVLPFFSRKQVNENVLRDVLRQSGLDVSKGSWISNMIDVIAKSDLADFTTEELAEELARRYNAG